MEAELVGLGEEPRICSGRDGAGTCGRRPTSESWRRRILAVAVTSCGGVDVGDIAGRVADGENDGGATAAAPAPAAGGEIVDRQLPGQAKVSVDGRDLVFTQPGGVECRITPESVTFSFRIGDNEVTIGGGANKYDYQWLGGFDLIVWNPEDEDAPIDYLIDVGENGLVVDGDSLSYSGPITHNDPDDPTSLEGIPVGDATLSLTCG